MTGTLPLWLASGLYMWQAWEFWKAGNPGMAFAFIGYVFANFGFIYAGSK